MAQYFTKGLILMMNLLAEARWVLTFLTSWLHTLSLVLLCIVSAKNIKLWNWSYKFPVFRYGVKIIFTLFFLINKEFLCEEYIRPSVTYYQWLNLQSDLVRFGLPVSFKTLKNNFVEIGCESRTLLKENIVTFTWILFIDRFWWNSVKAPQYFNVTERLWVLRVLWV